MHIRTNIAVLPLLALGSRAMAQDTTGQRQIRHCTVSIASHLQGLKCDALPRPQSVLHKEVKIKTPPVKFTVKSGACHVHVSLEYSQYDTAVRVHSVIKNADCAASQGSYLMNVAVRDSLGGLKRWHFRETWKREDSKPVVNTKQYAIGKNVALVSVRATRLECSCVGPARD